jgi:cysteinyl-tRNA synthetase
MAHAYLGNSFDIHGGGLDLVFPHHENEVAQSKAAGQDFANFWLHNAWVTTAGEKMSKSLGNSLLVTEVAKRARPIEVRWYLASAHYRSNLEFSDSALAESATAFQRIEGFVKRASAIVGEVDLAKTKINSDFAAAMDEDLNVPAALAVLHEVVGNGNTLLAANTSVKKVSEVLASVRKMLDILGVDPLADTWANVGGDSQQLTEVLDHFVKQQIQKRSDAKANKDFATADSIRDELRAAGIALEDTADGARWTLEQ